MDFDELAAKVELILNELEALPGVEATAVSSPVPGMLDDGSGFQFGIATLRIDGRDDTQSEAKAQIRVVSPSYFETMQIPLVAGELCRVIPPTPDHAGRGHGQRRVRDALLRQRVGGRRRDHSAEPQVALRIAGVAGNAREFALDQPAVPL